jgi:hydrogenase expression/formation protein HypD
MKYLDEFHDPKLAKGLLRAIEELVDREISLMEVCGTHTVAIFRHGIKRVLPSSIRLLSGPGCPVCVTPTRDVDAAIWFAGQSDVILTTFGDMMRVPGTNGSLEDARADGADVRVVYSVMDALGLAKENPSKRVVFFGVGFETTSPSIASTLSFAKMEKTKNFFVYSCHKLIPPAMRGILEAGEVKVDGFICPGHVSTIIGSLPYEFIADEFGLPCVIAGFEPLDILQAIYMLARQIKNGRAQVEIQYLRSVRPTGNRKALSKLYEVFEPADSEWRGIGTIPASGLSIRDEYKGFDASLHFDIPSQDVGEDRKGCRCGEILRGLLSPPECPLFGDLCTPQSPVGPCMVSSEGTCAAHYRYEGPGL